MNFEQRYKKISYLDAGSFSTCYIGSHDSLESTLVLKYGKRKHDIHLPNEKMILEKLKDVDQVCHLVDYDLNALCLVIEYFPGIDLFEYLESRKLSENDSKSLFKKIAKIMFSFHERKIVHNDIKLENILINPEQEVRIIDFGLSFISEDGKIPFSFKNCGSAPYVCPEKFDANHEIENAFKVDVWSLGVILFTMLSKRFPYDPIQLKSEAARSNYPNYSLAEDSDKFSKNALDLVSSMLKGDPKQRISMEDVISHPWLQ